MNEERKSFSWCGAAGGCGSDGWLQSLCLLPLIKSLSPRLTKLPILFQGEAFVMPCLIEVVRLKMLIKWI
jgi:hypothetical protein